MVSYAVPQMSQGFRPGLVVTLTDDVMGVRAPNDGLVPGPDLGPGLVEKIAPDGRVRVRWMDAEFDAWMDPADLRSRGEYAHLISVYQCDGRGNSTLQRRAVVETAGLAYNWTIELRPDHIVRAVRGDGAAWTFRWFPDIQLLSTVWPQPPEDADAEAVTAVELAGLTA